MPVFEIDGLPYIDAEWLERRIYRDEVRCRRWRQEAQRMAKRSDPDGIATQAAYLWQALQATYRAERWRRNLALTQTAIVNLQQSTRLEFGLLVRERRLAAGLTLIGLSRLAGLDDKTIKNIETASFALSRRSIEAIIAVPELRLSWADVSQELLEANPADGRKHKSRKK